MSIDIKSYKERYDKLSENNVVDDLTNISREKVEELFNFGFTYNYEHRRFDAEIEINGHSYSVHIRKSVLEKERLARYTVHFPPIIEKVRDVNMNTKYTYLTGAYHDFHLHYELTEKYNPVNVLAIFNHIYTVYRLNQKEDKATFKEFVSKEKETEQETNIQNS